MLYNILTHLYFGYDFSFNFTNAVLCVIVIIAGGILSTKTDKKIFWLIVLAGIVWAVYMLKDIGQ